MARKSAQRGEGNAGCIIWLVVVAVALLIGWKAIPVKIRSAELYDHMVDLTKYSNSASTEELEKRILARALELELPLDKDHVKVERIGERIKMQAEYTVPLEFPGYSHEWHFHHVVDRPIFIF